MSSSPRPTSLMKKVRENEDCQVMLGQRHDLFGASKHGFRLRTSTFIREYACSVGIFFCFRCASIVVYKKSLGGVVAVVEKP